MPDGNGDLTAAEIDQLRVGAIKYIDQRFTDHDKLVDQRFTASEKAVDKALDSLNRRFDTTNEWRFALDEFVRSLIPKTTYEEKMKAIDGRLIELERYKDVTDSKASQRSLSSTQLMLYIMSAISVIGFALSLIDRLLGK